MVHLDDTFSCFPQSGINFDQIVLEGASGGIEALIRYLQSRRLMLLRESSQISLRNDDPAHFVRAIEVIDDALRLLEQFERMNIRAALEEAASEYERTSGDVAQALSGRGG